MDKPTNLPFPLPDLDMVFVEGGRFDMGDATGDLHERCRPVHPVEVSSFYLCQYQVTQQLYQQVAKASPSYFKGEKRPVEQVSWDDVQTFIGQLNNLDVVKNYLFEKGMVNHSFRLPTEAEWEYAARGGIYSQGYDFCGSDKLKQVGWYDENSNNETHNVGLKLANELGLHDMSGNVWEWCHDWFDEEYYEKCKTKGLVKNPTGADRGGHRSLRGGSCFDFADYCRPTYRRRRRPDRRSTDIGFRLCLSPQSVG